MRNLEMAVKLNGKTKEKLNIKPEVKLDVKVDIILILFSHFIRAFYLLVYIKIFGFGHSLLGGPLLPIRSAGDGGDGGKKVDKNKVGKTRRGKRNLDRLEDREKKERKKWAKNGVEKRKEKGASYTFSPHF